MFGLSCAAQRGCWKLFQDTPTVQAPAAADPAALASLLAAALGALLAAVLGAALPPELEHAAKTIAATDITATNLRLIMLTPSSSVPSPPSDPSISALGYHPPWAVRRARMSGTCLLDQAVAGPDPERRIGEQWFERVLSSAEQWCVHPERGRHHPHERPGRAQGAQIQLHLDDLLDERMDPGKEPAHDDEARVEQVDEPRESDPEPVGDLFEGERC